MHTNIILIILVLITWNYYSIIQAIGYGYNFTAIYREYLENLLLIIDNQVDGCDNFFQHACGNFGNESIHDYDWWVPPFLYNQQDRFNHFISNKSKFSTKPAQLLNRLYDLCVQWVSSDKSNSVTAYGNVAGKKVIDRRQWYALLHEIIFFKRDRFILMKWPFLAHQWQEYQSKLFMNWPKLLAELTTHNIHTFINTFFVKNTIYLAAEVNMTCLSIEAIIKKLKIFLGKRHAQVAHIIGNELWTFCQQLISIEGSRDTLNRSNQTHYIEFLKEFTWQQYLQQLFISLNFNIADVQNARTVVVNESLLSEVLLLLNNTDDRIIYNFLILTTIQQLEIADCFSLIENFEDDILLPEYWNWKIFETTPAAATTAAPDVPEVSAAPKAPGPAATSTPTPIPHIKRSVALASYLWHITLYQRLRRHKLRSEDWSRFLQSKIERQDLNIERAIKTYGQNQLNLINSYGFYQNISAPYASSASEFFQLWLKMRRIQKYSKFFLPYIDKENNENHPYYYFKEFLHFTILLLYRPIVHFYASQGRNMWHQAKLLYSSDSFFTFYDCMQQQQQRYQNVHNNSENSSNNPNNDHLSFETIQTIYEFSMTFWAASEDYKFWLHGEHFAIAEDFILEYFHLDRKRIMFYVITQQYCSRNDAYFATIINRSFINMMEFQNAFNCSVDAAMNHEFKCTIRNNKLYT